MFFDTLYNPRRHKLNQVVISKAFYTSNLRIISYFKVLCKRLHNWFVWHERPPDSSARHISETINVQKCTQRFTVKQWPIKPQVPPSCAYMLSLKFINCLPISYLMNGRFFAFLLWMLNYWCINK